MERVEHVVKGRKYRALSDGNGGIILEGPPEGLVDGMGLPEPFATELHNILYERGMMNYQTVTQKPRELQGALQEVLQLDVQKLTEAYFRYSGGTS